MKLAVILIALALPAAAAAQSASHKQTHAHEVLGIVKFNNSGSPAAQASLQRGVALLHSFEYEEAARSFQEAQRIDSDLAVAYWLEALTYSRVLWGYENLDASRDVLVRLAPAREGRIAKAKTEWEREFGRAVEAFFAEGTLRERAHAYADGMQSLVTKYPRDEEAGAFAAIATMFAWYTAPAAERPKYNSAVHDNALRVFRANPQHPGAAHYLIHFVDMNPDQAKNALEFAKAYDKIAPDAEHALHMPSHVYLPLGMWQEVAASNERSWAASRKSIQSGKGDPADHSWHALDWLQYSYLQLGRIADARAIVDTAHAILRNATITDDNPDARFAVNLAAFRYGWETGNWDAYPEGIPSVDDVLRTPRTSARAWGMTTVAAYQAAVAALRARSDRAPADRVIAAFRAGVDSIPENDGRRATLRRLASQLEAMTAWSAGDRERAVAVLREIAPNEPNNASLPPTIIPSYELLGEYLLVLGRKQEAAAAFEKVLATRANRAASVRGLTQARS